MNPDIIYKAVSPRCREGFRPMYLLETEIAATSRVKKVWLFGEGKWQEISTGFNDAQATKIAKKPKIKYFVSGKELHCYVNDPEISYFDDFVMNLSELL